MAFLFPRNKSKVASDVVRSAKELLPKLSSIDQLPPQASPSPRLCEARLTDLTQAEESLAMKLANMKLILQGTTGARQTPQSVRL